MFINCYSSHQGRDNNDNCIYHISIYDTSFVDKKYRILIEKDCEYPWMISGARAIIETYPFKNIGQPLIAWIKDCERYYTIDQQMLEYNKSIKDFDQIKPMIEKYLLLS